MHRESIEVQYCVDPPSPQTMLDIFRGHWKSALPSELNLVTGTEQIFARDPRVVWAQELIPGGFQGREILELGPFEGYDTRLFETLGARAVWALEGNNINFLKCLVLKEALGLNAKLLYGDFRKFLRACQRRFDVVWASGVLYHSEDPIDLVEQIARCTNCLFIWTHYSTRPFANGRPSQFPVEERKVVQTSHGATVELHKQLYFASGQAGSLPLRWAGGSQAHSYWLTREGLLALLRAEGFDRIDVHQEGALEEMPYIGLLAQRSQAS